MANNLNANPWTLDTAGVISPMKIRINKLRWVSPGATGGDLVIVKEADGDIFWKSVASASNFTSESDQFRGVAGDCDGFTLDTISSGILFVYYE